MRWIGLIVIVWVLAPPVWAQAASLSVQDTVTTEAGSPEAAEAGRTPFGWEGGVFEARVTETPGKDFEAYVAFASPLSSGDSGIDTVRLRWYRPAEDDGGDGLPGGEQPGATAVLIVHTLHPDLPVATFLARGLRSKGIHAFVIEMPGYASRRATPRRMTGVTTLIRGTQAVADCRRAFDVIRTLGAQPGSGFDGRRVAIQGTSLGSFVACSAAAIDGCFEQTFLFLSGGDGMSILADGQKDAFHVRGALKHYGYEGDKLRELMGTIEPLNLASRLDPATTWMFNARDDLVIPAANAHRLAEAIGLDESHHIWLPGNHYTAFILLPGVLDRMEREIEAFEKPAVPVE